MIILSFIGNSRHSLGLSAEQLVNFFLDLLDIAVYIDFFKNDAHVYSVLRSIRIVLKIDLPLATLGMDTSKVWISILLIFFLLRRPGDIGVQIFAVLSQRALDDIFVVSRLCLSLLCDRRLIIIKLVQSVLIDLTSLWRHERLRFNNPFLLFQKLPVTHSF